MVRSSGLLGAAAALAVLFAGGQAAALDAPCLWSSIPSARQSVFVDHFNRTGLEGLRELPFGNAEVAIWMQQCGVDTTTSEAAGYLLGTYVMEHGSAQTLERQWGVKPADLKRAWAGAPSDQKAGASNYLKSLLGGAAAGPESMAALVGSLTSSLNLGAGARQQVLYYAFAILAREVKLAEMAA